MKHGFTIIELIFVIVVLGILSAVAIPKFKSTRIMADISKGRSDVQAIRSSILNERQSNLIKGINTFIPKLSDGSGTLFTGDGDRKLLLYGIVPGTTSGKWSSKIGDQEQYNFKVDTDNITFTYDSDKGTFTCDRSNDTCKKLVD